MNVDTNEWAALRDQAADVAAIGRKVSALTGRVSQLANSKDDWNIMLRVLAAVAERQAPEAPEPGKHAAPEGERHLRLIKGDRS